MDLAGKKVAVYGLGVSGLGALKFLKNRRLGKLLVVNRGPVKEWKNQVPETSYDTELLEESNEQCANLLAESDFILLAPGIPRENPVLSIALNNSIPVWNELELASRFFRRPIIALTGTNGKTTSVSFMQEVLKELGLNAFVGGNIGRSFLEGLSTEEEYDVALLEVSSFQCESLPTLKADVAGILNLFANHGERYESVEDYRQSKWLLAKAQTESDFFFIGPGVEKADFSPKSDVVEILLKESIELKTLFDLSQMKIVGEHNHFNLFFSWKMLKAYCEKFSIDDLEDAFQKAINNFFGVEHRIEYVGESDRYLIYNDAKSTNWQATVTALKAMKEREGRISLILGGQLRGNNDDPTEDFLNEAINVDIYVFGESGKVLNQKYSDWKYHEDLEEVINGLKGGSEKMTILFSPAFPSFDQFRNYAERGEVFKKLCKDSLI